MWECHWLPTFDDTGRFDMSHLQHPPAKGKTTSFRVVRTVTVVAGIAQVFMHEADVTAAG